jgi:hypothetical protein
MIRTPSLYSIAQHTVLRTVRPLLHAAVICGCAFLLCYPSSQASAKAVPPPEGFDNSSLSIRGEGLEPHAVVSLSTGQSQTLTAKADDKGKFSFNNLAYQSSKTLAFNLVLPKRTRGLVLGEPTNLHIKYMPRKSRVSITGNIGKAGHIMVGVMGAPDYKSYIAGEEGYITASAHTRTRLIHGTSEIKANIITATEVCCPKMIIPAPPVSLVISSVPGSRPKIDEEDYDTTPLEKKRPKTSIIPAGAAITPPSMPSILPNAPTPASVTTPSTPAAVTAPQQRPESKGTPSYINPNAAPKTGNTPSDKPKIPYINSGQIDGGIIISGTGDSVYAGGGGGNYDYDSTYSGSIKHMSQQVRQDIVANAEMVAAYFDGVNLMTALRKLGMSQVNTMKDYAPSTSICKFGTLVGSIASAEATAQSNKMVFQEMLANIQNQRMGTLYSSPAMGINATIQRFRDKYCNNVDNATFLKGYCSGGGDTLYNRDVDFTRVFEYPWTFQGDFTSMSGDAQNLLALFKNLSYIPPVFIENKDDIRSDDGTKVQDRHGLNALRSVANNTYASLTGMKVRSGTSRGDFMLKMLQKLGLSEQDAVKILYDRTYWDKNKPPPGAQPSYYAQMEILTKKIFQDPSFFADLYDSPQNVDRQKVAITAISLQQDRDFLESLRRREMLLSALLEAKLREAGTAVNTSINAANAVR